MLRADSVPLAYDAICRKKNNNPQEQYRLDYELTMTNYDYCIWTTVGCTMANGTQEFSFLKHIQRPRLTQSKRRRVEEVLCQGALKVP